MNELSTKFAWHEPDFWNGLKDQTRAGYYREQFAAALDGALMQPNTALKAAMLGARLNCLVTEMRSEFPLRIWRDFWVQVIPYENTLYVQFVAEEK